MLRAKLRIPGSCALMETKGQQYSINQIKRILESNNLTLVKADKSKAVVIMDKDKLEGVIYKKCFK